MTIHRPQQTIAGHGYQLETARSPQIRRFAYPITAGFPNGRNEQRLRHYGLGLAAHHRRSEEQHNVSVSGDVSLRERVGM